jgi:hypothetical protein
MFFYMSSLAIEKIAMGEEVGQLLILLFKKKVKVSAVVWI